MQRFERYKASIIQNLRSIPGGLFGPKSTRNICFIQMLQRDLKVHSQNCQAGTFIKAETAASHANNESETGILKILGH